MNDWRDNEIDASDVVEIEVVCDDEMTDDVPECDVNDVIRAARRLVSAARSLKSLPLGRRDRERLIERLYAETCSRWDQAFLSPRYEDLVRLTLAGMDGSETFETATDRVSTLSDEERGDVIEPDARTCARLAEEIGAAITDDVRRHAASDAWRRGVVFDRACYDANLTEYERVQANMCRPEIIESVFQQSAAPMDPPRCLVIEAAGVRIRFVFVHRGARGSRADRRGSAIGSRDPTAAVPAYDDVDAPPPILPAPSSCGASGPGASLAPDHHFLEHAT